MVYKALLVLLQTVWYNHPCEEVCSLIHTTAAIPKQCEVKIF